MNTTVDLIGTAISFIIGMTVALILDISIRGFRHYRTREVDDALEKVRVQLAGCSVAALGGTKDPANESDYGWSPAYRDVLKLRHRHDTMQNVLKDIMEYARKKGDDALADSAHAALNCQ